MTDRKDIDEERLARLRHGGAGGKGLPDDLAGDEAVRDVLAEWDRQDAALHALYDPVAHEPVPEQLAAAVAGAGAPRSVRPVWGRLAAGLVLLAIGGAAGWGAARLTPFGQTESDLAEVAHRAYVAYTPEIIHPVEVASDDADHLKAWLSKRVGRKLVLPNLSAENFQLLGGRIVPDEHGVGALLMYESADGNRMTLYITSEPDAAETGFRFADYDGVDSLWWYGDGLGCAVVADLPRDELKALATAAYQQLISA